MYFRSWKKAAEWGEEIYGNCSVWYDEDTGMFYAIPA